MPNDYPLEFTLEDGVHVTVNKSGTNTYDFTLTPEEGPARHFSFADDQPKDDLISTLDFDQLNAVRRFWLEQMMKCNCLNRCGSFALLCATK